MTLALWWVFVGVGVVVVGVGGILVRVCGGIVVLGCFYLHLDERKIFFVPIPFYSQISNER